MDFQRKDIPGCGQERKNSKKPHPGTHQAV